MRILVPLILLLIIPSVFLTQCRPSDQRARRHFAKDSLRAFTVEIDVSRDTILHTPHGAILRIPAHAIDGGGATHARLEIREAYHIRDIVRAGLLTTHNGQPLSSGGMIDIEGVGDQKLSIQKPISISIPTPFIEKNMQLYKGEPTANGDLNWTDPQPLRPTIYDTMLDAGQKLFVDHCASCHRMDQTITGPSLAYISRRRDIRWLNDFIHDNHAVIARGDRYALCLFEQYNRTPMPSYSQLSGEDLDALYRYINNESARLGLPMPDDHSKKCVDSCEYYEKELNRITMLRQQLVNDNGQAVHTERTMPAGYISPDTAGTIPKVSPNNYESEYYQFDIKAFGWYNIDVELQRLQGVRDSELKVRITDSYTERINLYFIIPSARVFDMGGLLTGKDDEYGFYTPDGRIPLPPNVRAIVLAMGEEKGELVFSMTTFQTKASQTLTLEPVPITKERMNARIRDLDLQDLSMTASDSKNADSIQIMDKALKDLDRFRPKTCDCLCGRNEKDTLIYK